MAQELERAGVRLVAAVAAAVVIVNTCAVTGEAEATARETLPDVVLGTNLIVGFPGETDEEFERSRAFCAERARRDHALARELRLTEARPDVTPVDVPR
jgi:tRNA A37 methylthiotransferase MiaB